MRVALVVLAVPLLVHAAGQNVVRGQDRDLARMRIRQDTDEQGGKTDGGNNNGGGVNTATGGGGGGAGGGDGTATNTQPTSATQPAETTTTANPESSPSPLPTSTTERAETTADTKPTTPTQQSLPNTSAAPSRTPKQVTSTNAEGSVILITESVFITASGTSSAAPSSTSEPESPGMGTKSIIGLSVAGGLFLLGLIGFIWWKLTRKRFAGFEDDGKYIHSNFIYGYLKIARLSPFVTFSRRRDQMARSQ
ncbi:hypothetical protein FRC03_010057 [Tulasnella sp. 419]|nr:hypothetical protein FRC03_010057 [Tulasnella sp. 419]